jgi:5-deoxy-D-glucuronate isomerase
VTRTIVTPDQAGDLIGLAVSDLDAGGTFESTGELETLVVVLSGIADVEAAGRRFSRDPVMRSTRHRGCPCG